jgi:hypothetical protein
MPECKHLLLLGAGFSRNWGGWLASEVFEFLLGCHEVATDRELLDLLWAYKIKGEGFENALAYLQDRFQRKQDARSSDLLRKLQSAIVAMFHDMNAGLLNRDFQFSRYLDKSINVFLGRFDAIFTLNQDFLLEAHYSFVQGPPPHKWSGKSFPGMVGSSARGVWQTDVPWEPSGALKIPPKTQPIFKLHGSANWRTSDGSDMLIVGGNKSPAIQSQSVLKWYEEQFKEYLHSNGARLMVIGYSFGDAHINEHLKVAGSAGLRLFIIDPAGSDVIERTKWPSGAIGAPGQPTALERMVIGGSRRSLREIFGDDDVEFRKVMRFFSD